MRRFSTSVAWGFALLACLLLLRIGLTVAEPTSPMLFGMSEMPGNASQPLRKLLPSVVSTSVNPPNRCSAWDASPMECLRRARQKSPRAARRTPSVSMAPVS